MENLGIDVKLLIAQVLNFALFFFLFKKFISKPFQNFMKGEIKKDSEKDKIYQEAKLKEEELKNKEQEFKKNIKKQTAILLAQAKKDAEEITKELREKAQKEITGMKNQNEILLHKERERLEKEIDKKIIDLSRLAINNLLKDDLSDEVRRQITQSLLNNLTRNPSRYEN